MPSIEQHYETCWEHPESDSDPSIQQPRLLPGRAVPHMAAGALILDVGRRHGNFRDFRVKRRFRAEGTDRSCGGVKHVRGHDPAAVFHGALVEDLLPARAGAFDMVLSWEVIEQLFDRGTYLMAINHLLKDGGTLVLTTPYPGLAKNLTIDLLNYAGHYDPMGQHIRFFDTKSVRGCQRTFGFEVDPWWGYGRPWPFWKSFFVVARKVAQAKPVRVGTQGRTS